MTAPTKEQAARELAAAEHAMNFHSPEWRAFEEWLGWRRYVLAVQILAENDDNIRAKMYGMANMCMELIKMGEVGRKAVANDETL